MTSGKCELCGDFALPQIAIQFQDGIVCRKCFQKSGLPDGNLASYKAHPVYIVLDDGDRKKQANERKLDTERRKREAEERLREAESIKKKNDLELADPPKEIVFRHRFFGGNDVVSFFLNREKVSVREGGRSTDYQLEQILEFEVLEDGYSLAKGGLGRAIVGAILFGGTGAIVGAVTGGKKAKGIVTRLGLQLTFRDPVNPVRYLEFIGVESKRDGFVYRGAVARLSEAVAMLKIMFNEYEKNRAKFDPDRPKDGQGGSVKSCADELIKLKSLLDQGVITKAEFAQQKKKLLQ